MGYWYYNFNAESIKMWLRLVYSFALWYEVFVQIDKGHFESGYEGNEDDFDDEYMDRKIGLIVMYSIIFIWNWIEKYMYYGTRPLVKLGGFYPVIHIILALVPIYWVYWPIVNGLMCTIYVVYFFMRWVQLGENDMESFKLHGPFRPGFKRFKAEEHGNDCMLFYPVNK